MNSQWVDFSPREAAKAKGIIYLTAVDSKEREAFREIMAMLGTTMVIPTLGDEYRVDFVAPSRYWMRRVMYWRRRLVRERAR
jgi:hypothetical protein